MFKLPLGNYKKTTQNLLYYHKGRSQINDTFYYIIYMMTNDMKTIKYYHGEKLNE